MDLRKAPFYLQEKAVLWVESTLAEMTLEQKIGQLFVHMISGQQDITEEKIDILTGKWQAGGVMFRPGDKKVISEAARKMQEKSLIPMMIAANLDSGGNGVVLDGTMVGAQMNAAAAKDPLMAYKLGKVCAAEGTAAGCNWTFAPVVDIDYNWRNPITNTRTFGSNPELVAEMASSFLKGVREYQMAACAKHFPGDGVDERDQHLLTSVNTLPADVWMDTYGMVYKKMIKEGIRTIMVGHIMQPAWQKKLNAQLQDKDLLPASLSPELLKGLLRETLGFEGLIVTDASQMLGFTTAMPRHLAVPKAIEAGCDMFLFGKCIEEDLEYMRDGVESGILSIERLNEAVMRVLALKASLGLNEEKEAEAPKLSVIGCREHKEIAEECADQSITLVRDRDKLLPLTPQKYKRILLVHLGGQKGFISGGDVSEYVTERFRKEGFDVTVYDGRDTMFDSFKSYKEKYDAAVYVANITTASNQTMVRISWRQPICADGPFFSADLPTVFCSLANPYHYVDVPSIGTIINAYSASETIVDALLSKLTGQSSFKGESPINPFGDRWVPADAAER